jgi:hypothetical protein
LAARPAGSLAGSLAADLAVVAALNIVKDMLLQSFYDHMHHIWYIFPLLGVLLPSQQLQMRWVPVLYSALESLTS